MRPILESNTHRSLFRQTAPVSRKRVINQFINDLTCDGLKDAHPSGRALPSAVNGSLPWWPPPRPLRGWLGPRSGPGVIPRSQPYLCLGFPGFFFEYPTQHQRLFSLSHFPVALREAAHDGQHQSQRDLRSPVRGREELHSTGGRSGISSLWSSSGIETPWTI